MSDHIPTDNPKHYRVEYLNTQTDQYEPVANPMLMDVFASLNYPSRLSYRYGNMGRTQTYRLIKDKDYEIEVSYTVRVTAESLEAAEQQIEQQIENNLPHDAQDITLEHLYT